MVGLAGRQPGRARLEEGRPWQVVITFAHGWSALRLPSGGEAPTWDEIDRFLAEDGYGRTEAAPGRAPRGGDEFDVAGWSPHLGRWPPWDDSEGAGPPRDVAVTLPLVEVGEIRRALDALSAHLVRPEQTARVTALIAGLDAIGTVTVTLPEATATALRFTTSLVGDRTEGLDGGTVHAIGALTRYLGSTQPVAGPWPRVRATLRDALREALSLPGAEGLAARDELLAVLRGFADAHATATAADDAQQRDLQAERAGVDGTQP
ncbi:hypothetical protein [Streptomyces sp. NPDC098781]|uniref:hypothetical protein n=1 Tax=Streptomyces sp. NPDC098781 TaxID=3366097 RepID=UPI0037F810FE